MVLAWKYKSVQRTKTHRYLTSANLINKTFAIPWHAETINKLFDWIQSNVRFDVFFLLLLLTLSEPSTSGLDGYRGDRSLSCFSKLPP